MSNNIAENFSKHVGELSSSSDSYDLICLSHLRWDFVTQRPQHLLSRCAKEHRVFFVEEPVFDAETSYLDVTDRPSGVRVLVPHLGRDLPESSWDSTQEALLLSFLEERKVDRYVLWVYTPVALGYAQAFAPLATIYDCMDELSAFDGASPLLQEREAELFRRADIVFTGGQSLYEAKKTQHPHVYAFPSSVEVSHFAQARRSWEDPQDQAAIPHPRLGFFGVVDERFDLALLSSVAELRPEWHFVILGPVVKIDSTTLPRGANIHYLGGKSYADLPAYIANWDVALLLFARNKATRFISPTKTPEYLAAGKPVVSTSIHDVIRPYGEKGIVHIADTPEEFANAVEAALAEDSGERQKKADILLEGNSWDSTWAKMADLIDTAILDRSNGKF